jgi:hypothetical protein
MSNDTVPSIVTDSKTEPVKKRKFPLPKRFIAITGVAAAALAAGAVVYAKKTKDEENSADLELPEETVTVEYLSDLDSNQS